MEGTEAEDEEREVRGLVCVAAERWKKDATSGSESREVASDSPFATFLLLAVSGIEETVFSNLSLRLSRFTEAVSNNECRACVRESSIGLKIYLLVPYMVAAAAERM